MLWLKLGLTPLVVAAITLIGRRYGPRAAGLVIGLPVTTGPVSVFLALERGPGFALRAAGGTVDGLVGVGCFCAAYALFALRLAWPLALAGALASFGLATLALEHVPVVLPLAAVPVVVTLLVLWAGVSWLTAGLDVGPSVVSATGVGRVRRRAAALRLLSPRRWQARRRLRLARPGPGAGVMAAWRRRGAGLPGWDLSGRVLVTTAIVLAVTGTAGVLGSRLSGLLSALPVFAAVLGAYTQQREGRAAAVALMRGLIAGCVSGVLFFAVVGGLLASGAVARTYLTAALVAAASGLLVTQLTRRRPPQPAPRPASRQRLRRAA